MNPSFLNLFIAVMWLLGTSDGSAQAVCKWARLKFDLDMENPIQRKTGWILRPEEDIQFIRNINKQAGLQCEESLYIADVANLDEMTQYSFIFMHAEERPVLTPRHKKNLREYLLRGGFLYMDDCLAKGGKQLPDGRWGTIFFDDMMKIIPEILPEATIRPLPQEHEIFNFFYKTPWYFSPYRGDRVRELPGDRFQIMENTAILTRKEFEKTHYVFHGIFLKNHLAGIITGTDLHCDWGGRYGEDQALLANQIMINIYLYAMTH